MSGPEDDGGDADATFVEAGFATFEGEIVGGDGVGVFDAAIVGGEDDERVLLKTAFLKRLADFSDGAIEVFEHRGVGCVVVSEVPELRLLCEVSDAFLWCLKWGVDGEWQ